MLIAIDGYNFIKQSPELRRLEEIELQKAREGLIEELARYKRLKGHAILVIFDGWQAGGAAGRRERIRGIEALFSRAGEKADDVLKRLAAEKREGITIVTSDNEVAFHSGKCGSPVISSAEFSERMEMAKYFDLKGGAGEPESLGWGANTLKKGPSRRLPKSRRKNLAAKRKL
jgi:predicted RNA-binding protein with PIN domain